MLTGSNSFALPFSFRGLLGRDSTAGIAAPPRRSVPPSPPRASDPPPRPEPAAPERRARPEWTAGIGADPSTHERLAFGSFYGR
jgi:hypothetical protein